VVVAQRTAETLTAHDAAAHGGVVVHGSEELVVERLMISFREIVSDVVSNDPTRVALTQRYDTSQTLAPY
jgi:hypothetical protein